MHIHILGVCGTFMGGVAALAKQAGHHVTGCDANVYPPMSTQLIEQGIHLIEGFDAEQLNLNPDLYVIGNVVSRGNPLMEAILNNGLDYMSGPQWLSEHILKYCRVLAIAGTHGKTTTSSMTAWCLEHAGYEPGFLIGGVAKNLKVSARLPKHFQTQLNKPWFVIEADEYDTAFFDKRSKFVHYRPEIAVLNNLEYDHADIFPDLEAIQIQFHHLVRTIPSQGVVVYNDDDENLRKVIEKGCWSQLMAFGKQGRFKVTTLNDYLNVTDHDQNDEKQIPWSMMGSHNEANANAVLSALLTVGLGKNQILEGLSTFEGVARRMEVKGVAQGVTIYDDFAHHPTAIATTLQGLRNKIPGQRIVAVIEPRSNTMKQGVWANTLASSLRIADYVFCYGANLDWDIENALLPIREKLSIVNDLDTLVEKIHQFVKPQDHVLIMSNGGFGGIHTKLLKALES